MTRHLPLAAVRTWLENWASWALDRAGCYPQAFSLAGAEGDYRCPQRNHHHEPPTSTPMPVYAIPAQTAESLMSAWINEPGWRAPRIAVKVEYVLHPAYLMRAKPAHRWTEIRAHAAHLAPETYWQALNDAHARLAADLWPHRWEFPRAQTANR